MTVVKPKKKLGQHFLTDLSIARRIVDCLPAKTTNVLEIGPGMGVLTQFLLQNQALNLLAIDIDRESVSYLEKKFPEHSQKILHGDFLKAEISNFFQGEPFFIIGNFPYNISSQILFRVLDQKELIGGVVGMFQKEVAQRIASPPGSKVYGILSVLVQAYYHVEYLFTVHEHVFSPPPAVKSAVISLTRNDVTGLGCDEIMFTRVVKMAFNQRRKMLRNSIKSLLQDDGFSHPFLERRPEQLSVKEFVELTNAVSNLKN